MDSQAIVGVGHHVAEELPQLVAAHNARRRGRLEVDQHAVGDGVAVGDAERETEREDRVDHELLRACQRTVILETRAGYRDQI
jgi:hypothetical protein